MSDKKPRPTPGWSIGEELLYRLRRQDAERYPAKWGEARWDDVDALWAPGELPAEQPRTTERRSGGRHGWTDAEFDQHFNAAMTAAEEDVGAEQVSLKVIARHFVTKNGSRGIHPDRLATLRTQRRRGFRR